MQEYDIIVRSEAREELSEIIAYLSEPYPESINKLWNQFQSATNSLSCLPERGVPFRKNDSNAKLLWKWIDNNHRYRLFYQIQGERVIILHVRSGGHPEARKPIGG